MPSGSLEQAVTNNDTVPAEGNSKIAKYNGTVKGKLFFCANCATILNTRRGESDIGPGTALVG